MKLPEHLADRPCWRGLPVPYVNWWGAEECQEDIRLGFDRHVGQIAAFIDDQPGGPPDFTRQCVQRQRECVVLGLCQVCRRQVDWADRRLVVSSVSVQTVDVAGRRVPVVTEPWLCPDCAGFATTVCPALIRRRHGEDLHIVRVAGPADCRIVLSTGWVEGRYEAVTREKPVVMWAKIALLNVRLKVRVDERLSVGS